jgi:hypothetical protein
MRIKRLYPINAGPYITYIAAGAYMWHRTAKASPRAEMFNGFGEAVLLQGGLLLVFDAAMYLLQQGNERMFSGVIRAVIAL